MVSSRDAKYIIEIMVSSRDAKYIRVASEGTHMYRNYDLLSIVLIFYI